MTAWHIAQDTFNAELKAGGSVTVQKGSHWPDGHEVVLKDEGRRKLFQPMAEDEPVKPAPKRTAAKGS